MLTIYPYETLGKADHSWLKARHHFSFARYYNPERTGFGLLRVINDDIIAAGKGFDIHPHRDMEIITYVRKGAITHRDDKGNEGRTEAGDVQVMSAGSGIAHSEYNMENEDTSLYQIWIETNKPGVQPSWDAHIFPKDQVEDALSLLVSGDGYAPLHIHQDAKIYAGRLNAGTELTHPIEKQAYILASEGEMRINGQTMKRGDGAEVTQEKEIIIDAIQDAEILVIDVPEAA